MGLDISAYKRIALGSNTDDSNVRLYPNPDFPAQADGIAEGHYTFKDHENGPSMSYGRYNRWRIQLATMAGYDDINAVWKGIMPPHAPFVELLNFSDCEGVIGAATSKKLAQDFATFDAKAKLQDQNFYDAYVEFHACFSCAADAGAVKFY